MGFLDDASDLIGRGATAARAAVSNVACEQLGFMRSFLSLCHEGAQSGWHERNGGNASCVLTADDIQAARPFFHEIPGSWESLEDEGVPALAQAFVLVTASGCYLKNVAAAPAKNAGIIEMNGAGTAWRIVWGFADGGRPTSEIAAHLMAHQARWRAESGRSRVLYHAHPASVAALTALIEPDSRALSNLLWRCLTESVIAFPRGVAALPWMVPGSRELARATADALLCFDACLWQLHGVFAAGATCDDVFGMVQAIDKAATVALLVQGAGVSGKAAARLSDDDLRAIAAAYDLPLNEAFL